MPRTFIAASTPRMARGLKARVRWATTRVRRSGRNGAGAAALRDGLQPDVRLRLGRLRELVEQRRARRAALALGDHAVEPGRALFLLPGCVRGTHACLRYWIASARCAVVMASLPARSATLRASLSTRW